MRIESPRSTERDLDEPEAVEPETNEPEAAGSEETDREGAEHKSDYESEHGHGVGRDPEIAEPATAEPETGGYGRADEEPAVHGPGAHEPGAHETSAYEPSGYGSSGYGSSAYGSTAHEPVADESGTGAREGTMDERGIDEERGFDEEHSFDEPVAAGYGADEPVPYTSVSGDPVTGEAVSSPGDAVSAPTTEPPEFGAPLIAADESTRFHEQIHQIQGTFVDDPRQSVRDAEHLLEDIVRSLAAGLEERRRALTSLSGEDGSGTEELRQALRSYRSLATQLLGPEN